MQGKKDCFTRYPEWQSFNFFQRRELKKLYNKGDYISYGSNGVCKVEGITLKDVPGSCEQHQYYILKPVYRPNGTLYCPVDEGKGGIRRRIMTEEESYRLLNEAPQVEGISSSNRKEFDIKCKEAVASGQCEEWLKVIKALSSEQIKRKRQGKRLATTHERILRLAAENLCGELAVSLNQDIFDIESTLKDLLISN